jgi:tellurite methyltransferase
MSVETWDQRYMRGEHTADVPAAFLARFVEESLPGNGRRALDLACGAGRHSVLLALHGWDVTAVDWSGAALASIRARGLPIRTVQANLEAGEFRIETASWDLICITYFLERDLFPGIRRGIKPGGLVVAAFPLEDARPGIKPMNPAYLLKPGELAGLFAGFQLIHVAEVEDSPTSRRRAELVARRA